MRATSTAGMRGEPRHGAVETGVIKGRIGYFVQPRRCVDCRRDGYDMAKAKTAAATRARSDAAAHRARACVRPPCSSLRGRRATINDIARLAERLEEDGVARHQPVAVRAAKRPAPRSTRSSARSAIAPDPQARGLAFRRSFLIGLDLRQPERAVHRQHPARRARCVARLGLRARRASVRPQQRGFHSRRACASSSGRSCSA